jgi:hypothetical protein
MGLCRICTKGFARSAKALPTNTQPVNVLNKYLFVGMVAAPDVPACLRRSYFDHAEITAAADD